MSDNPYTFRGNVQVYLQGQEALEPVAGVSADHMAYYVASPDSRIEVRDYRSTPVQAAQRILAGQNEAVFADSFNQPAWVEIRSSSEQVEIELHDSRSNGKGPTLWLGVIRDATMPVHDVKWEILKPVNDSAIAFAALVS